MEKGMGETTSSRVYFYDFLRLLGAVFVVLGHNWILFGGHTAPELLGIEIHHLGLLTFFALSGYLIEKSAVRHKFLNFVLRRILRLLPALWVVTLATLFLVGPIISGLPAGEYFASGHTWKYLSNLVLITEHYLVDLTDLVPYPHSINGSLWTLPLEFAFYLSLAITFHFALRRLAVVEVHLRLFRSVTLATLVVIYFSGYLLTSQSSPLGVAFELGVAFFAGSLASSSNLRGIISTLLLALSGLLFLALSDLVLPLLWWLPFLLAVIIQAPRLSFRFLKPVFQRIGDLSYGTYLWGFPVSQLVLAKFSTISLTELNFYSLLIVLPLASLSWKFVERPSMKFARSGT